MFGAGGYDGSMTCFTAEYAPHASLPLPLLVTVLTRSHPCAHVRRHHRRMPRSIPEAKGRVPNAHQDAIWDVKWHPAGHLLASGRYVPHLEAANSAWCFAP